MSEDYGNIFNIRYIKLHFTLQMVSDCVLPINKSSAIRGGLGEMMLRANCIRNRECERCDFEEECIVQRTMYSKFKKKPESVNVGDSIGYVIECENYDEYFNAGDELRFNLILFGKTIVYFNQYMQSLFALGRCGIGADKARFIVKSVENTRREPILNDNNLFMARYKVSTVGDYVRYRLSRIKRDCEFERNRICFKTLLTIKINGELLNEFSLPALVKSVQRRLYILACFEDLDTDMAEEFYRTNYEMPECFGQEAQPISVRRFSYRKGEAMYLNGIKGSMEIGKLSDELLPILLAGELIHVGKNTSFGFGKYRVE